MKAQYYAVLWGAEQRSDASNLRISAKVADPGAACRDCFGLVTENMQVKSLGSSKSVLQNYRRRMAALESREGWEPVPEEYLDNLELRLRRNNGSKVDG